MKNLNWMIIETNRTVIDKIKYLYKRLYKAELFSSSLTVRMNKRDDFYEYSRQHQPAFKIAMMELLSHPDEMNARIPFYCCYILREDDFIKLYDGYNPKLDLKNHTYVWVHNEKENHMIKTNLYDEYINKGFIRGRKQFNKIIN